MSASVEELRQEALVGPRIWAKKCHWQFGKSSNNVWIAKDAIFQRCKAKLLGKGLCALEAKRMRS
jgi:hypothetical protein